MNISLAFISLGWSVAVASPASLDPGAAADPTFDTSGTRALDASAPTAVVAAVGSEEPVHVAVETDAPEPDPGQPDASSVTPAKATQESVDEAKQPWRGFRYASKDGAYSLSFGFLAQLRTSVRDTRGADAQGGVAVRLARPVFIANLWHGRVAMRFMPEFAGGTPAMLDTTATVRVHEAFAVQVGQFRPWLNRGFRTGLPVLGLPGRGIIVDRFRVDRDVGVTVLGQPLGGKLEYYVGVMNGSGRDMTTLAPSPLVTARFVVAPLGAVPYVQTPYVREVGPRSPTRRDEPTNGLVVAVGASGYTVANRESLEQTDGTTLDTDPRRRFGASGDLVVSRRRVFGLAEGFYEHRAGLSEVGVPTQQSWGAYAQAGVLAWNPFVDLTMRVGYIDDDRRLAPIEPGLNAYIFGNNGKLQVAYRCDVNAGEGEAGCVAHTGTLQAQLQF